MKNFYPTIFIILIFIAAPFSRLHADVLGIGHFFSHTIPDSFQNGWHSVQDFAQNTIYDQGLKQTIYENGLRDTIYEQGLRDAVFDKGLKPAAAEVQAHGIEVLVAGVQNSLIGAAAGMMTCGPACATIGLGGGFASGMALKIADIATEGRITSAGAEIGKGTGSGALAGALEGFIAGGPEGAAIGAGIGAGLGAAATATSIYAPNVTIPVVNINTNQLLTNIALGGGAAGITKFASGFAERMAAKELASAVASTTLKGLIGGTVTGFVNQEAEHNINQDSTVGSILVPAIETGTQIATMEAAQQRGLGSALKTLAASGGVSALGGAYGAAVKQSAQTFGLTKAPDQGGGGENLDQEKEDLDQSIISKMYDPDVINSLRQQATFNKTYDLNSYNPQAIQAASDNGFVLSPSGKLSFSPDYITQVQQSFSQSGITLTQDQIAKAENQLTQMLQPQRTTKALPFNLPSALKNAIPTGPAPGALAAQIPSVTTAAPMTPDQIVAAAAQRGYNVAPDGSVTYSAAKRDELKKQGYLLQSDGGVTITLAKINELQKASGVQLSPEAVQMAEIQLSANMRAQLSGFLFASPQILAMQTPAMQQQARKTLMDSVNASAFWQKKQAAIAVRAAREKFNEPMKETPLAELNKERAAYTKAIHDQEATKEQLNAGIKALDQVSSTIVTKLTARAEQAEKIAVAQQIQRNIVNAALKKEKDAKEKKANEEQAKKQKEESAKAEQEKAKQEEENKKTIAAATGTLKPEKLTPEQQAIESKKAIAGTLSEAAKKQQKVLEDTYHQALANAQRKASLDWRGVPTYKANNPLYQAKLKQLTQQINETWAGKVTELPAKPAAAPAKPAEAKPLEVKSAATVPNPKAKTPIAKKPASHEVKTPAKPAVVIKHEENKPAVIKPEPKVAAKPETKTPVSEKKIPAKPVVAKPAENKPVAVKPEPAKKPVPAAAKPEVKKVPAPHEVKTPAQPAVVVKHEENKPAVIKPEPKAVAKPEAKTPVSEKKIPAKPVVAKPAEIKAVTAKPEPAKKPVPAAAKPEVKKVPAPHEVNEPPRPVVTKHEENKPPVIEHEPKAAAKPESRPAPVKRPVEHPRPEPRPEPRPAPRAIHPPKPNPQPRAGG